MRVGERCVKQALSISLSFVHGRAPKSLQQPFDLPPDDAAFGGRDCDASVAVARCVLGGAAAEDQLRGEEGR